MPGLRGARHSSRTPRAGKQESRFLFDASQFAGVPLLLLHLHATQNLNALGLRAAGPMHGLGEITHRIAAQCHVLDESQDTHAIFGGDVVTAFEEATDDVAGFFIVQILFAAVVLWCPD